MKITVKLRFASTKAKIENFGKNRYLVYLLSDKTDEDAMDELKAMLSRSLAVPADKVEYCGKDANNDAIFEI